MRDYGHCELLDRDFIFRTDIEHVCKLQNPDNPYCLKCKAEPEEAKQEVKLDERTERAIRKMCESCQTPFTVQSNRQRFCPRCSEQNKRAKNRLRKRRNRENPVGASFVTL